jgi:ribonuclease BN (tRNA processing enzyme)
MEVIVLGTGIPVQDPQRGSSANLLNTGSARILLDCRRNGIQQTLRTTSAGTLKMETS